MSVIVKGIFGKEMPMPQEGYVDIRLHFKSGRIECATMPTGNPPYYATFKVAKLHPHGRLIDVDAHILEIRKQYCEDCSRRKGIKNGKMKFLYEIGGVVCRACEIEDMLNELDDAPTVIEAEGENNA